MALWVRGPDAHSNFVCRVRCVACDASRPRKVVRHASETVPSFPRDRPWSGEARLRQSEKEVQELRMDLNTLKRKEAHDIPVGDDKDTGMDDVAETVEGPCDDLQRLRAKKREMQRTLVAVKKMPTMVCGDFVAVQAKGPEGQYTEPRRRYRGIASCPPKGGSGPPLLGRSNKGLGKSPGAPRPGARRA